MSVKILETKKNALFKREEVKAVISHEGKPTPTREDILPSLVTSLKTKKELILIDKIFSIKGKGESSLKVFVYSKAEDIPKERLGLIDKRSAKRKGKKAEGEAPEEKAEAKKEEEHHKHEEKKHEKEHHHEKKEEKKE